MHRPTAFKAETRGEIKLPVALLQPVVNLHEIHLGTAKSSAPFRVKSEELLSQLHLQVAVH